ncbi:MAG: tetratricopeptide repeat protein [Pirellulaceae bacterium]|nr:tetratricopeptide repeat protein [Pirellulaceae bacterium]
MPRGEVVTASGVEESGGVVQAGGDVVTADEQVSGNRLVNFLSSIREDIPAAKSLYQQGDKAFRAAQAKPREEAIGDYSAAAAFFRKAGNAAPGTALQQDAMFMQAESHFFADELTDATKAYQKLQKEFPRNRHNDRIAARLFAISKYWIDASKAGSDAWYKVNLFDTKRPGYDSKGHAVRVLDQIRYDDPTGRLADDATMAAAAEYIRQEEYEKADEFLTDLRETFTDSDHMFHAHLLGIRCKLEIYAGPDYSGLVLEEAKTLIRQTRSRFPDKLQNQKYADMVARAAKEVSYHQAERLAHRARFREKRSEYGAASAQYAKILEEHPSTPQAKVARARLGETSKRQPVPDQRLAWLTKIFPDSKQSAPLKTIDAKGQAPESTSGTMLR